MCQNSSVLTELETTVPLEARFLIKGLFSAMAQSIEYVKGIFDVRLLSRGLFSEMLSIS